MTSMTQFPATLTLSVQPVALRQLAGEMGDGRLVLPEPRKDEVALWRRRLSESTRAERLAWTYAPEWRRVLPNLVARDEQPKVREGAIELVTQHQQRLPVESLVGALAHTLDPELHAALITHSSNSHSRLPVWLLELQPSAERPLEMLAQRCWREASTLAEALDIAAVVRGTWIFRELETALFRSASKSLVEANAHLWLSEVQGRRRSGDAALACLDVICRYLPKTTPGHDHVQRWYESAALFCGGTTQEARGSWASLSDQARDLARRVEMLADLGGFFRSLNLDDERFKYWEGKLPIIRDVYVFAPYLNAIMIQIGNRHLVEFGESGACYGYTQHEWQSIRAISSPNRSQLKLETVRWAGTHWLTHRGNWQARFDRYIEEHC